VNAKILRPEVPSVLAKPKSWCPVFIHRRARRSRGAVQGQRLAREHDRHPLDTTIALSHLIFEGTLDKFPKMKICSAHGEASCRPMPPPSDNSLRVAPDMDTA